MKNDTEKKDQTLKYVRIEFLVHRVLIMLYSTLF